MAPTPETSPSPISSDNNSSPSPPPPDSSNNNSSPSPPSPDSSNNNSPPSPPPPDSSNNNSSPSPPPPDSSNSNSSPSEKSSPPPPSKSSSGSSPTPPSPPPPSHSSSSSRSTPPPPPARISHSPPPPALHDKGGDEFKSTAIIGGALGVGIVLLFMIVVCVICSRKKKRKKMYYYDDRPSGKGGDYYGNEHQSNWRAGSYGPNHVVKLNQSPSGMGHGGGGWGAPPPPPAIVSSTDMSSNYSFGPPPLPPPSPTRALGLKGTFSYEELASATNGFSNDLLIGQGGFGYVHKGVLPNGKEVAVKSLKAGSGQGEREFQAEIDIISRVHHRHLVSLVGYCIAGGQRMLVYEFVPNNNLEYHLHGKGVPTMDWSKRLRIAVGSAKGLSYLHEDCHPRIIHRDIKAANVLIDDSFEAKVADFGLAKLTSDNNTHVSTRVMGTFGYLAPEYASSGKLSEKSDVFSFGVMLLELITGKRPVDVSHAMDDSLVDWARPLLAKGLGNGNFAELADPFLEGNYDNQEMARMAACAAASIRHSGRKRPRMSQIVRGLEGEVSLDDLNEAMMPPRNVFSIGSSDSDSSPLNDAKFGKMTSNGSSEALSGADSTVVSSKLQK